MITVRKKWMSRNRNKNRAPGKLNVLALKSLTTNWFKMLFYASIMAILWMNVSTNFSRRFHFRAQLQLNQTWMWERCKRPCMIYKLKTCVDTLTMYKFMFNHNLFHLFAHSICVHNCFFISSALARATETKSNLILKSLRLLWDSLLFFINFKLKIHYEFA